MYKKPSLQYNVANMKSYIKTHIQLCLYFAAGRHTTKGVTAGGGDGVERGLNLHALSTHFVQPSVFKSTLQTVMLYVSKFSN